jgi:hypothetical protein
VKQYIIEFFCQSCNVISKEEEEEEEEEEKKQTRRLTFH